MRSGSRWMAGQGRLCKNAFCSIQRDPSRLEKDFVQKGGIRERMTRARLDDRDGKK